MADKDYPWEWYEVPEELFDGSPGCFYFEHNGFTVSESNYPCAATYYNVSLIETGTAVGSMLSEADMRVMIGWEEAV
jgi:hypothetical protein